MISDTEPDGWGRRVIQRDHAKRRAGRALSMTPRDLEDFAGAFEHPERLAARKEIS